MELWTSLGLGVFAVLMPACWWSARRRDHAAMTVALTAPVCVAVAFVVAEVVKRLVAEVRTCRSLPHSFYVDSCPAPDDYAFPSGHTTVAFATVAVLFLLDRRLSGIGAVFAVVEGFSRVCVGAHYPHDILASATLALPVAFLAGLALQRLATPLVASLRRGVLRPLLTADSAASGTNQQAGTALEGDRGTTTAPRPAPLRPSCPARPGRDAIPSGL